MALLSLLVSQFDSFDEERNRGAAANHDLAAARTFNHLRCGVDGEYVSHRVGPHSGRLLDTAGGGNDAPNLGYPSGAANSQCEAG